MSKLTALKVRKAEPGKHSDGNGLYLVVRPNGGKQWVLRIQARGRRHDVGLGSAQTVSLAEARGAALDMRRAFERGEDPLAARRKAKGQVSLPSGFGPYVVEMMM